MITKPDRYDKSNDLLTFHICTKLDHMINIRRLTSSPLFVKRQKPNEESFECSKLSRRKLAFDAGNRQASSLNSRSTFFTSSKLNCSKYFLFSFSFLLVEIKFGAKSHKRLHIFSTAVTWTFFLTFFSVRRSFCFKSARLCGTLLQFS